MLFENEIKPEYLETKAALKETFPVASNFLDYLERLTNKGFHLGTFKNLNFYYKEKFFFHLRRLSSNVVQLSSNPKGALKANTTNHSEYFFDLLTNQLRTKNLGADQIDIQDANGHKIKVSASADASQFFEILKTTIDMVNDEDISESFDPVEQMIEDYKKRIAKNQLKEEVYKWELVREYKGRPDVAAVDFYQEVKSIKYKNLIYPMAMAVMHRLAEKRPDEIRKLFINLFNGNIDISDRVKSFNKETKSIYKELEPSLGHHQDERSIATYLTFFDAEKYTFYKSSFYKKYCGLLGVKPATKNEKYTHYLALIDDLIKNYIAPDRELIELVKNLIPTHYDGSNHMLLAQDILFQMLDQAIKTSYWIFQGNPNVFDFETALEEEVLTDWTVTAHKDKIKAGDKVILWITGDKAGCYAMAEVTSKPHPKSSSPDDHLWKEEDTSELKADIKITHNLINSPILKAQIDNIDALNKLKVGNQGTNFSASKTEFDALISLATSESSFDEVKNKFDKKHFDHYIFYLRKLNDELGLKPNDKRTVFSVRNGRLNFTVGQRYCFNLYHPARRGVYGVISREKLSESSEPFGGNSPQPFYTHQQEFTPTSEEWQSITQAVKEELERTEVSGHRKFNNSDFENYVFASEPYIKQEAMKFPLNTILYGPPGTGKTYNTVLRAAKIIENRTIESYDEALRIFKANLHNRIEFITFHQNYSYEDFIQGLRPDTENDSQLTFERKDGVFKVIADKALANLQESEKPELVKIPFEQAFNHFINPLVESDKEELEVKMKKVSYFITAVTDKSIQFRKASGGTAHTLSISTLKKMYKSESVLEIQGLAPYYSPLLAALLKIGKDSKGKTEQIQRQNYVIIIDEINRANISRVFGELITLIEPDKRSHGAIAMEARLPSGDNFMVPSNLYIIGTMNTADKSIALLDIALRRRFEFEAMYPQYDIPNVDIYDVDILQSLNEQIIKSKGHDFQIGHAYFMGENDNLIQRMNKKVIPLLLEYYMNDEKEVKELLKGAGLSLEDGSWPLRIVGRIS